MGLYDSLSQIDAASHRRSDAASAAAPAISEEERDAFYAVLRSRRSVRRFTGEPLDDKAVERALGAALLAPNSSNLQLWQFVRVKSPTARADLARAAMGQPAATTASEIIVCVSRPDQWQLHRDALLALLGRERVGKSVVDYYERIVPLTYRVGPMGVGGWVRSWTARLLSYLRPTPQFDGGRTYPRIVAIKSCALACENLMLALRAEGYDTCPMEGFDSRRVAKALALEGEFDIPMLIAVGKRAEGGVYGQQVRFPLGTSVRTL